MTPAYDQDDGAMDAIMFLAYLKDLSSSVPSVTGPEPTLAPEDQRALDALGPDLAARIVAGQVRPRPRSDPATNSVAPSRQIAAAMNRGGEDGKLSDAAREEIARKIKELEEGDEKQGPAK
jgi:hypothetical protein